MANKKNKKKTAAKKSKPTRSVKLKKHSGAKAAKRASVKKGAAVKKMAAQKAPLKKIPAKKVAKRKIRGKSERVGLADYENTRLGATGGQSGDTQGLSGIADAESESVKELLEEGQSFEAEVVQGVESVPDADEGEVRTHEVPEDDVPDDYIGKDGQN